MTTGSKVTKNHGSQVRAASSINAILGIWLIFTPWIYGYAATARGTAWNSIFVGIAILILGTLRYRSPHDHVGLSWVNIVLGAWTLASPWIYAYAQNQEMLRNSVTAGIAVTTLALWSGSATLTEHHRRVA